MPAAHSRHPQRADAPASCGLAQVRERIAKMREAHDRAADSIRLIAVSKQQPGEKVAAAARAGQCDFAENYLQEGVEKIESVTELLSDDKTAPLCWHFIGRMQSRKCRDIATHFDWVHSIDSIAHAEKLNQGREQFQAARAPLNALIQINLQDEDSKGGVGAPKLTELARGINALPHLRLRGLMLIPKPETDFARQRAVFRRCRELRDELNARGFALQHLSMGMSGDMEAAIAEGATMLRIGTAIFGARGKKT